MFKPKQKKLNIDEFSPCPNAHAITLDEVARALDLDPARGLASNVASSRLVHYGPNELKTSDGPPTLRIFISNLINTMNVVLFIFGIVCAATKGYAETGIIVFVIVANTAFGFFTELKSAKTIDALKKLSSPDARVIRDGGQVTTIDTVALVPGDIVCLEEGDQVPADLRVLETVNLTINESLLTGESAAIRKHIDPVDLMAPLGDRKNMIYKSTLVNMGRGKGMVVATGFQTEIGKIAKQVTDNSFSFKRTPLENSMSNMMRWLLVGSIFLAFIVLASSHFDWGNVRVWIYAVALAVAILPECLPLVTMITMTIGVSRMAKEKAIVRKQVSLELLGQVTNVCSDKTGTLTEGKMTMVSGWLYEQWVQVEGSFQKEGNFISRLPKSQFHEFFLVAGLCNTCEIQLDLDTEQYIGFGDTTEVALGIVATREGFPKSSFFSTYTLLNEFPFDSSIKRMSVVYRDEKTQDVIILSKGAIESLWPLCTHYMTSNLDSNADANATSLEPQTMSMLATDTYYESTLQARMLDMSNKGQRVLALAFRRIPASEVTFEFLSLVKDIQHRVQVELNLTFLGLVGIVDPPRPETAPSIQDCHRAGIVVHMITGDHPSTAAAIAREIGILPASSAPYPSSSSSFNATTASSGIQAKSMSRQDNLVMTSVQFDALTEAELDQLPQLPLVVARCSPDTKVNMIRALHRRGKFVAMTGDGVNDAPAVSHADVGIAMGLGGSDVTKQASDITLTDDRFSSIVKAIAQGRRIFANIQKFTLHLLSGNVSEMVVLVFGLIIRDANTYAIYPMTPSQILYLNLVTSSPVALGLGLEKASKKLMKEPPRNHGVFTKELLLDTFVYGSVMGLLSLFSFILVVVVPGYHLTLTANCDTQMDPNRQCEPIFRGRAVSFVNLCLLLLVHGFVCRHPRRSSFYIKWQECKFLIGVIVFFSFTSMILPYLPKANTEFFHHSPFDLEWAYIVGSLVIFIAFTEVYKSIKRKTFASNQRKSTKSSTKHHGPSSDPLRDDKLNV